jgi:hypothetical protein
MFNFVRLSSNITMCQKHLSEVGRTGGDELAPMNAPLCENHATAAGVRTLETRIGLR